MQHGLMPVSWSVHRSTDSPTKLSSYCKVEQEGAALSLVITLLVITFILLQQTQNNAHNSIFDNIFFPSWVRTFLVTNFCMLALLLVVVVVMLLLLLLLYSFQGCFIDSSTICAVLEVYIANSCSKKQFYNFVVLYENFSIGNHFQIGCTGTEVTNVKTLFSVQIIFLSSISFWSASSTLGPVFWAVVQFWSELLKCVLMVQ